MLPPGFFRLLTSPLPTGSPADAKTTGMELGGFAAAVASLQIRAGRDDYVDGGGNKSGGHRQEVSRLSERLAVNDFDVVGCLWIGRYVPVQSSKLVFKSGNVLFPGFLVGCYQEANLRHCFPPTPGPDARLTENPGPRLEENSGKSSWRHYAKRCIDRKRSGDYDGL